MERQGVFKRIEQHQQIVPDALHLLAAGVFPLRHLRYPPERLLYAMVRATGAGGYGFRREAVVSAEYPGHVRISVFGIREVSSNCALSPIEKHKELMVKLGEGVKVVME